MKNEVNYNTPTKLKKASKNNSWSNVNSIIEKCGLEINLIQDLAFLKLWEVKNNKTITHISNTLNIMDGTSILKFCWNH